MTNINRSLFLQTTLLRSALLFQLLCVSIVILPTQQQTPSQAQLAQFNMTGNGTADYDDDEDEESITGDPFDEKTSLPETAIRDLMNLDVGKYTTQRFDYYNYQNEMLSWKRTSQFETRCYDDYIRCLTTQTMIYKICAYSRYIKKRKFRIQLNSYCDMYMDNCRKGTRFWVGYKRGPCRWYFKNKLHVIDMYYSGYGVK
nr:uncharacterized protein LOC128680607 isoform X1 [Plodia interpunctella]